MRNGPSDYRTMAELCRRHAEELSDGQERARWLRIAEGWMVIARDAERERIVTPTAKAVLPIVFEQHV